MRLLFAQNAVLRANYGLVHASVDNFSIICTRINLSIQIDYFWGLGSGLFEIDRIVFLKIHLLLEILIYLFHLQ